MSDVIVENPYKFYVMILLVGLFVAFISGFAVGSQVRQPVQVASPQVINTGPFPVNYDVAKHDQEVLQSCYKVITDQVALLRELSAKTDLAVTTAMADLTKVCHQKEIVIATPGTAEVLELRKRKLTH